MKHMNFKMYFLTYSDKICYHILFIISRGNVQVHIITLYYFRLFCMPLNNNIVTFQI